MQRYTKKVSFTKGNICFFIKKILPLTKKNVTLQNKCDFYKFMSPARLRLATYEVLVNTFEDDLNTVDKSCRLPTLSVKK